MLTICFCNWIFLFLPLFYLVFLPASSAPLVKLHAMWPRPSISGSWWFHQEVDTSLKHSIYITHSLWKMGFNDKMIILPKNNIFSFFLFLVFRPALAAYGRSWARGRIEAAAAGLCHSHSNAGSGLSLGPIPQLKAIPHP